MRDTREWEIESGHHAEQGGTIPRGLNQLGISMSLPISVLDRLREQNRRVKLL